MNSYDKLALATILEMRGKNNKREYTGGTSVCICPKCKVEVSHVRNTPCNQIKCPECDALMTGKGAVGEIK
jgi:hypothetical protein